MIETASEFDFYPLTMALELNAIFIFRVNRTNLSNASIVHANMCQCLS